MPEQIVFDQIHAKMSELSYEKGGLLGREKKSLPPTHAYLFIGLGGTGGDAVQALKKEMSRSVLAADMKHVSFLCIDTDANKLLERTHNGMAAQETFPLESGTAVKETINPTTSSDKIKNWVNPGLYGATGKGEFNGTGAGARRQVGRTHIMYPLNYNNLQSTIVNSVSNVVNGIPNVVLNVFIFAGIAGGTGSGTFIDMGIVIRHFMNRNFKPILSKLMMRGYAFLPSACGQGVALGTDAQVGNANAYATLKELDYFMTIAQSCDDKPYVEYYGTEEITVTENIFDFCTIVEGQNQGQYVNNPAERARQVTIQSIMNMITNSKKKTATGTDAFLVESFESNQLAKNRAIIMNYEDSVMPRNANYPYGIIGFSQCVIPIDLIQTYVAKKIHDAVSTSFAEASLMDTTEASEKKTQKAKDFLEYCQVGEKVMDRAGDTRLNADMKAGLEAGIRAYLIKYGPYYMINMTKYVNDYVIPDYIRAIKTRGDGLFGVNKQKNDDAVSKYEDLKRYMYKQNDELFEIYTKVLDELKAILEADAGLLTDAKRHDREFGSSYYWSPVDLSAGDAAQGALKQFLDNQIINAEKIQDAAKRFVKEMVDHKDEWTELLANGEGKFNAVLRIREFIKGNVSEITNDSIEDMLAKIYSKNVNAVSVTMDDKGQKIPTQELVSAAYEIFNKFQLSAQPLAHMGAAYTAAGYKMSYIVVPSMCEFLYEELEKLAGAGNVFKSESTDSISFYNFYFCTAAFMLEWVKDGEKAYEVNRKEVGLHMGQSPTGTRWELYPDLYVEDLWLNAAYKGSVNEKSIIDDVDSAMEKLSKYGLITYDNNLEYPYTMMLPKSGITADEIIAAANLKKGKQYEVKDVLAESKLFNDAVQIKFDQSVFVPAPGSAASQSPEAMKAYQWKLSKKVVRKKYYQMLRVLELSKVFDEIEEKLNGINAAGAEGKRFSTFVELVKREVLTYDIRKNKWILRLKGADEVSSARLAQKVKIEAKEYFGFRFIATLDDKTYKACVKACDADLDDDEYDKALEVGDALKELAKLIRRGELDNYSYPMNTEEFIEALAELEDYSDGMETEIREFYDKLIKEL